MPDNIILLTIDCLRPDKLNSYGNHRNISPNIDHLAKEGTKFTQAFSNGPKTNFSFPSIFTSSYALTYPLKEFKTQESGGLYMPSLYGGVTLAEILRQQGFYTIGLHSNPFLSSYYNYNRGFSNFMDLLDRSLTSVSDPISNFKRYLEICCGRNEYYNAFEITEIAVDYIRKIMPKKIFLWIHYMDLHYPYSAHSFFINAINYFKFFFNPRKRFFNLKDKSQIFEKLYEFALMYMDWHIGELIKKLEELGIYLDENILILTSDHGEEFGEHGEFGHGVKLYDELLHVPLIIIGQGIEKCKTIESQVELMNIPPTICDCVKIKKPKTYLGRNFFNPVSNGKDNEGIISEYFSKDESGFSYRTESWKFILTIKNGIVSRELYDLTETNREMMDIYETHKDIATIGEKRILRHIEMECAIRKKYSLIQKIKEVKKRLI